MAGVINPELILANNGVEVQANPLDARLETGNVEGQALSHRFGDFPATSGLALCFILVFAVMWQRRIRPDVVTVSYRQIVLGFELWRVVTSAFSHLDFLHLSFNITSLWALREVEAKMGSVGYLLASAHILVMTEAITLSVYHFLIKKGNRISSALPLFLSLLLGSVAVDSVALGYAMEMGLEVPQAYPGGIVFSGPMAVLASLVVTRLLIRRSSFAAHLGGIFAGAFVASGALDFARQTYWGLGLLVGGGGMLLASLKVTRRIPIPGFDYVDLRGLAGMASAICNMFLAKSSAWYSSRTFSVPLLTLIARTMSGLRQV